MQTFLPYVYNFDLSAKALDNKRLNKQLLEGRQIYAALLGRTKGWVNHPATRMWRNHENMLYKYLYAIMRECKRRGIATEKNWSAIEELHESNWNRGEGLTVPTWMVDESIANKIEITHRGNLYNKDPEYYFEFYRESKKFHNYVCCDKCNYYWFTHKLINNEEF
jgi:hypothetical protein